MLFTYRLKPAKKKVPHKESIFPKEYMMANFVGLPVITPEIKIRLTCERPKRQYFDYKAKGKAN
jgi:hypothetical protein